MFIFASMNTIKQNRSKYNFGTRKVGDEITVEPLDVHSMLSSLGAYNRRHGRKIELEATGELTENGESKFKVTKI